MKRGLTICALALCATGTAWASPANVERAHSLWQQRHQRQLTPLERKQLERIGRGSPRLVDGFGGAKLQASITTKSGTRINYALKLVKDYKGTLKPLAITHAYKKDGQITIFSESEAGHFGVSREGVVRKAWTLQDRADRRWRLPEHLMYGFEHASYGISALPSPGDAVFIERYHDSNSGLVSRGVLASRRLETPREGFTAAPPPTSANRRLLKQLYRKVVSSKLDGVYGKEHRQAHEAGVAELAELLHSSPKVIEHEMSLALHAARTKGNYAIKGSGLDGNLSQLRQTLSFPKGRSGRIALADPTETRGALQRAFGKAFAKLNPKEQKMVWAVGVLRHTPQQVMEQILGQGTLLAKAGQVLAQANDKLLKGTIESLPSSFGMKERKLIEAALAAKLEDSPQSLLPRISKRPEYAPFPTLDRRPDLTEFLGTGDMP